MRLFSSDLYRNFAIGFAVGGLLIAGANADQWAQDLAPPVHAADAAPAAGVSAESFITSAQAQPE
ncbi:MAG: hypothetical protein ACXIT4_02085 [Erythrobacter sp.]